MELKSFPNYQKVAMEFSRLYRDNLHTATYGNEVVFEMGVGGMIIPMVAFDIFQPYYARSVLEEVADNSNGRFFVDSSASPEVVIPVLGDFDSTLATLNKVSQKKRTLKTRKDLTVSWENPNLSIDRLLASNGILDAKNNLVLQDSSQLAMTLIVSRSKDYYNWVSIYLKGEWLASAYYLVSDTEVYWVSYVNSFSPNSRKYNAGSQLILLMLEVAVKEGKNLNLGLYYDYKVSDWVDNVVCAPGLAFNQS